MVPLRPVQNKSKPIFPRENLEKHQEVQVGDRKDAIESAFSLEKRNVLI